MNCNTTGYATDLANSINGASVSGKVVTITLDGTTESATYTLSGGQVRVDSITVTYVSVKDDCNHVLNDNSHTCSLCSKTVTQCEDQDKNHLCDVCSKELSECSDTDSNHKCDVCDKELTECVDADLNHKCDICETNMGTHIAKEGSHICEYCNKSASDCIDEDEDGNCDICGEVLKGEEDTPKEPELLATFNLGANGTATHNDGTSKTSYEETVNGITLSLTNGSNMYTGARDAMGNSCIKLGTSKVTGSFEFTVPENVTSVKIYVAKYKSNTTKITVNETAYTLTNNSADGAYDIITVDTTETKTIIFSTATGGIRAMVNSIEFIGIPE